MDVSTSCQLVRAHTLIPSCLLNIMIHFGIDVSNHKHQLMFSSFSEWLKLLSPFPKPLFLAPTSEGRKQTNKFDLDSAMFNSSNTYMHTAFNPRQR